MKPKLAPDSPMLFRTPSYYVCTAADFTAGTSQFLITSRPTAGAKEAWLVATKLGLNSFQRIETFRNYSEGWDFGEGDPMSEHAYSSLCEFLEVANLPNQKRPSVFLTGAGNLELSWETPAGANVQAEFGPETIEYYHGATGEEGQAPSSQAHLVARALSA